MAPMRRAGAIAILILPAAAAACGAAAPKPSAQASRACSATSRRGARHGGAADLRPGRARSQRGRRRRRASHRSAALARAVAAQDPRATRAALAPLLKHRIARIDDLRRRPHARPLRQGRRPTRRSAALIGAGAGRYVLSVGDDHAYEAITHALTGATVGSAAAGGTSFAATRFPAGARRSTSASRRAAARRVRPDGRRHARGHDRAHRAQPASPPRRTGPRGPAGAAPRGEGRRPSAARSRPATRPAVRAAIIGFFRDNRFHIVRVRAWKGTHLITDVGGPYVLSPASAPIHARRRRRRALHAVGPGRHRLHQAHAPVHRRRGRAPCRRQDRAGQQPVPRPAVRPRPADRDLPRARATAPTASRPRPFPAAACSSRCSMPA